MPLLAIAGLVVLVIVLCNRTSNGGAAGENGKQELPPANFIASAGLNGAISPAMSGGSPMINRTFAVAAETNSGLPGRDLARASPGTVNPFGAKGLFKPALTVAQQSKELMTVARVPTAQTDNRPNPNTLRPKL